MPRGVQERRPTPPSPRRYWPVGRRGLGRGLSALISAGDSVGGLRFEEVPVSAIRPNTHQPRRQFSETSIKELAASIREVGILQPLVIRLAERVRSERFSVRKTEELVREELAEPQESPKAGAKLGGKQDEFERYHEVSRRIQDALTLPTRVRASRKGGRIEIHFREKEELEALVALLTAKSAEHDRSAHELGPGR